MEKNTSVGGMMLRLPGWAGSAAMKTAVMCLAEALIAALLSRGVILGAYAPLGAAWAASVAAVTPERQRIRSYASLMGAVLGYCVAAQVDGLRYAAAAVLAAAVVMVLREVKHVLFLPAAVVISFLATGAVYAFTGAPTAGKVILFFCEAIAAGGAAYFYGICRRQLPGARDGALSREDSGRVGGKLGQWELYREVTPPSAMVRAAWAVAAASVAACLRLHAPLWGIRLGCLFALICVLACVQAGAAHSACAGLLLGAALDLCAGEILPRGYINAGLTSNGAVFAAVYGFLGLFAGIYRRKGPFIVSLAFVLGNAAALPWLWKGTAAPLFEGFAASVLYLCFSRPLRDLTAQLFPRRGVRIDPGAAPPGEDIGGANLAPVL